MKIRTLPIAAAMAAMLFCGSVFAQGDRPGDDRPPPPPPGDATDPGDGPTGPPEIDRRPDHQLFPFWRNERIATALELTPEQIRLLEASLKEALAGLEELGDAVPQAQRALREALDQDEPAYRRVIAALAALKEAEKARESIVLGHVVAVKTTLTAEQEEMLHRIMRRLGHDGNPPPPPPNDRLREAIRQAMEQAKPLLERMLADCEFGEEDQQAIRRYLGSLPDPVREAVGPRIRQMIQRILAACDGDGDPPPPPDDGIREQVRAAMQQAERMLHEMLADCDLSEREAAAIDGFLADLPDPVREIVNPRVREMIRRILAACDGGDDPPADDGIREQVRAALRELMPKLREALADCELSSEEEAAIERFLGGLEPAVREVVAENAKRAIAAILAACDGEGNDRPGRLPAGDEDDPVKKQLQRDDLGRDGARARLN